VLALQQELVLESSSEQERRVLVLQELWQERESQRRERL
jgi:hypothetical protein